MKIKVSLCTGDTLEVEAECYGDWAAHPRVAMIGPDSFAIDKHAGWVVSHVPSGRSTGSLVDALEMEDAIAIAIKLGDTIKAPTVVSAYRQRYEIEAMIAEALDYRERVEAGRKAA